MAGLVKANSTLTKEISRQKSPSHNGFQLLLGQKAFHESHSRSRLLIRCGYKLCIAQIV